MRVMVRDIKRMLTEASEKGYVEMSRDEVLNYLADMSDDQGSEPSPVDVIDAETGEVYVEENKPPNSSRLWTIVHPVSFSELKKKYEIDDEDDDYGGDGYDRSIYIYEEDPNDFVDAFENEYRVEKRSLFDDVEDPEGMMDAGYDVESYVPELARRRDAERFNSVDVENVKRFIKSWNDSSNTPENITLEGGADEGDEFAEFDVSFV